MRTISLTLFAFTTLVSIATARDITTVSGRSYQQCQAVKVTPDGVTFRHSKGIAKVLFSDMNENAQRAFGYDEGKEKAFQEQQVKARAEKKEIAKQKADATAKAYAEARQAHLENQTLLAMQRAANAQLLANQQQMNGVVIGAVGVGPGFSYSMDGRDYARSARRGHNGLSYPQPQPFSQSLFNHYGALINYGQPLYPTINGCATPRYPVVHPGHARPQLHQVPCAVRGVSTIPSMRR